VCAAEDEIELLNERVYKGKIVDETSDKVFITIESAGTLSFDKSKIKEIRYEGRMPIKVSQPAPAPVSASSTPQPSPSVPSLQEAIIEQPAPATPESYLPTPTLPTAPEGTPTPPPPDVQTGYDAVLYGAVKDVKVRLAGAPWANAEEGTQLKVNDEIMTGEGKAKIKLRGRGELRLPPNSYLILKYLSPDGNQVTIDIRGGAVWNNVTPGGGLVNYKVQTPDLTAGVRGTLFKVEISGDKGTRVAVFEGAVETTNLKTNEAVVVDKLKSVTVDKAGVTSELRAVDPKERDEWDHWDEWALEVHKIAVRFPVGGQAIDNLAKLHAQDMKRYEKIVNEANQNILTNREADKVEDIAKCFERFYLDTGVVPTVEQGFKVLVEDPGVAGWKGPYYDGDIPPKDRWGNELHYIVETSQVSGNQYGKVISSGPNGIYSKGATTTDDLASFVRYYALTPNTQE
jgi:hypothetical protein